MRLTLVMIQFLLLLATAGCGGCGGGGSLVHSADRAAVDALEEGGVFDIQLHQVGKARVARLKIPTEMTDEMVVHLAGLDALQQLDLSDAPITDAALEQLAALTRLERLILSGTDVTDEGLVHLEGLADLETLDVTGTSVTEDAKDAFEEKTDAIVSRGEPDDE